MWGPFHVKKWRFKEKNGERNEMGKERNCMRPKIVKAKNREHQLRGLL